MSADLWAAFGNSEDATINPWSQHSPSDNGKQSKQPAQKMMETPSSSQVTMPISQNSQAQLSSTLQSPWNNEVTFSPAYKPAVIGFHVDAVWDEPDKEDDVAWTDFAGPGDGIDPWASSRSVPATETLWDFDQANDDENDFGDFEAPTNDISSKISNLALIDDSSKPFKDQIATGNRHRSFSSSFADKAPARGRSAAQQDLHPTPKARVLQREIEEPDRNSKHASIQLLDSKSEAPLIDGPPWMTDEEWDEWSPDPLKSARFSGQTVLSPTPSDSKRAASKSTTTEHNSAMSTSSDNSAPRNISRANSQSRLPPISTLPPTNIPPPSILTSLLSILISTLPTQVEKAMAVFTTNSASASEADEALSTAVRKCLAALRVSARIVAGRKLRWKRDTHLSQSMRIGPAASGGKGGMKLSGVDRNELKREDREVAEFVRIWQAKLGSVRRALASVNSRIGESDATSSSSASRSGSGGKKLELPSIAETMVIRTLKDEDGGVRSAKGCALCGIKREERVDKVDGLDVFDVSREWWIEHWGHRECRAFWYQHEKYLQQR